MLRSLIVKSRLDKFLTSCSIRCVSSASLLGRNFLSYKDYERDEIYRFLWTAKDLKHRMQAEQQLYQPLRGKSITMVFQKRSTRTRLSTETGMTLLGGHATFLGADDIHLGVNESTQDSARVLSGYTDVIMARVYNHSMLTDLCSGTVPVINGLSDTYHPLQILADLMTLQEHFDKLRSLKLAYVGDGNNMAHSYITACTRLDMDLRVATPRGYEADQNVVEDGKKLAMNLQNRNEVVYCHDPLEAVRGADAIITDTWVSMGQEEEKVERLKAFDGFQVNTEMMNEASSGCVFLHCLPRKSEEVSDEVFYSDKSLVWKEAHNRMWTAMSVILHLLKEHTPHIPKPNYD